MRKRVRVTHPTDSPFASEKAVTQQHLVEAADINAIVAKARRGIAPTNVRDPSSGRFADLGDSPQDLTEAYARVQRAEEAFASLPARARDELGNDPRKLLQADGEFFVRHGLAELVQPPEAPLEPAQAPQPEARTASLAAPSVKPGKAKTELPAQD